MGSAGKDAHVSRVKFLTLKLQACPLFGTENLYKWSVFGAVGIFDEEDHLCDEISIEGDVVI